MAAEDYKEFLEELSDLPQSALRLDEPMGRHTSFNVGGSADVFFDPPGPDELCSALAAAARLDVPVSYLGGGTNVLIADRGIRGLVLRLGRAFDYIRWGSESERDCSVDVGAATRLTRLVRESVERGLQGLEFAAGIPGTVGGAALMNAGAFGGEIGEAISAVQAVRKDGRRLSIDKSELEFSYRHLALDADVMIFSVSFLLLRSSAGRLRRIVETVQQKRRKGQPLGFPNAGSVFKNPPNEYAGRLLERAGLKGTVIGGAQISPEHSNFIVNLGSAKADDVRKLMGLMQDEVWKRSGIWLEPEVRLIGEWGCG